MSWRSRAEEEHYGRPAEFTLKLKLTTKLDGEGIAEIVHNAAYAVEEYLFTRNDRGEQVWRGRVTDEDGREIGAWKWEEEP